MGRFVSNGRLAQINWGRKRYCLLEYYLNKCKYLLLDLKINAEKHFLIFGKVFYFFSTLQSDGWQKIAFHSNVILKVVIKIISILITLLRTGYVKDIFSTI